MRLFLILATIATLATFASCGASRDDKQAMANLWHMGRALQEAPQNAGMVTAIGGEIVRMAERHEQQFKYAIDKTPVKRVGGAQ